MRVNGYLIFDGCWLDRAIHWSYATLPDHEPVPVLLNTEYHALAELGPIMVQASIGDAADELWNKPDSPIQQAVWLESSLNPQAMLEFLQARLKVSSADGQSFWLRLTDSRPLVRVFEKNDRWPEGFWNGVEAVWIRENERIFAAWRPQAQFLTASSTKKDAHTSFILDHETLRSLARKDMESST